MDESPLPWLARLLQTSDSAFPTGSYAQSYGFEQSVRLGVVRDEASLAFHLERHLWPMLVHFELPALRFAQHAALDDDSSTLIELDACVDATMTARESREASRATGRRRMEALMATGSSAILENFARAVAEDRAQGHHSIVYGIGLAPLPTPALLTSWAFQSLSAVCLAAPKLIRIGQNATQRVLTTALADMEANVTQSLAVSRDELGWFDPLLEIASMQHEIAHERLFIS
jgi:urease accessory protein